MLLWFLSWKAFFKWWILFILILWVSLSKVVFSPFSFLNQFSISFGKLFLFSILFSWVSNFKPVDFYASSHPFEDCIRSIPYGVNKEKGIERHKRDVTCVDHYHMSIDHQHLPQPKIVHHLHPQLLQPCDPHYHLCMLHPYCPKFHPPHKHQSHPYLFW